MVASRYLQLCLAILAVSGAKGFAPSGFGPLTSTRGGFQSRPSAAAVTQLHWGSKWFGRKQGNGNGGDPVRFIAMDSGEEKDATDVYASKMNSDETNGNDLYIDATATKVKKEKPEFKEKTDYDVIVVGGGCSGVGTALMLTRTFGLDSKRVLVVEQGKQIGESFRRWPDEMRFISPSFNQQGWTESFDLNAIHYDTSPAFMLRSEHPTGEEYAIYLEAIATQGDLNVSLETKVLSIQDAGKKENGYPGPFQVQTCKDDVTEEISTRYIVWAAGEFMHPKDQEISKAKKSNSNSSSSSNNDNDNDNAPPMSFPGADLCMHNSKVDSWAKLEGDDYIVIGGYESGIDAAVNLARAGKKCKVLASTPCWNIKTGDPSSELAPYTSDRLRSVLAHDFSPSPKLFSPLRVIAVDDLGNGEFGVAAKWKETDDNAPPSTYTSNGFRAEVPGDEDSVKVFRTKNPPILCTGFEGSVAAQASHLFAFPDPNAASKGCVGDGPLLRKNDESTVVDGVFLVGPSVSHGDLSFCFVYKFRQRFAVVANAICEGLGMDTDAAVNECRKTNMYLDNFLTCEDTCGDAC